MENATKALIIAGAILISILIIALGVMVYNNASGTVSSSDMTATEIETFNQEFLQYMSDNMSSTSVTSLIQKVQASNEAEYSSGNNRYIFMRVKTYNNNTLNTYDYGDSEEYVASKTVSTVSQTTKYKYEVTYDSGIITTIQIVPVGETFDSLSDSDTTS